MLFHRYEVQDLRILSCYPGQKHLTDFYAALRECSATASFKTLTFNNLPCGPTLDSLLVNTAFPHLHSLNFDLPPTFSISRRYGNSVCRKLDASMLFNFVKSKHQNRWDVNITTAGAKLCECILHPGVQDAPLFELSHLIQWIGAVLLF